jgi:hypothetical protein
MLLKEVPVFAVMTLEPTRLSSPKMLPKSNLHAVVLPNAREGEHYPKGTLHDSIYLSSTCVREFF